jgi:hypothetical protein
MNAQSEKQTRLLKEILKWIRFSGMKEAKNTLGSVLDTEQKRLVYHASDGTRGTVEIAKLAGIGSTQTVFGLWQAWLRLGLGESIPVKGGSRFKRSFDLEDFGIEIPRSKVVAKEEKQAAQSVSSPKTTEVPDKSPEESHV